MKFSIIIPVYNVERYLENCLDSVLLQDFDNNDYEVIVVNDCSPDNSEAIVLDYQKRYPNLIYVKHNVNRHLGGARNTGIRKAKGDFLIFLDSDDFLGFSNSLSLISELINNNAPVDAIIWNNRSVDETESYNGNRIDSKFSYICISSYDYLKSKYYHSAAWKACYRRDIITENDLFFRENIVFEDSDWSLSVFLKFDNIICTDLNIYKYRKNQNSITNTPSVKHFHDNILGIQKSYEVLLADENIPENVRKSCLNRLSGHILSWIRISRLYTIRDSLNVLSSLRHQQMMKTENYELSKFDKLRFWLMVHQPICLVSPYRIGWHCKRVLKQVFQFFCKNG